MKVYAYGVARNRLHQAAKRLNVPMEVVDDFGQADAVVTLKNYYRRRPKVITDAERRGMPIYVLRANTVSQMENFLSVMFIVLRRAIPATLLRSLCLRRSKLLCEFAPARRWLSSNHRHRMFASNNTISRNGRMCLARVTVKPIIGTSASLQTNQPENKKATSRTGSLFLC